MSKLCKSMKAFIKRELLPNYADELPEPIESVYHKIMMEPETPEQIELKKAFKFSDKIKDLHVPDGTILITKSGLIVHFTTGCWIYYKDVLLFKCFFNYCMLNGGYITSPKWLQSGPWEKTAYEEIKEAWEIEKVERDEKIKLENIERDENIKLKLSSYGDPETTKEIIYNFKNKKDDDDKQ